MHIYFNEKKKGKLKMLCQKPSGSSKTVFLQSSYSFNTYFSFSLCSLNCPVYGNMDQSPL